MTENKMIKLDVLTIADMFAKKNAMIAQCETDMVTIKWEIKDLKKSSMNLEWPERKEWISDEEYEKIKSAMIWLNRMAINKRIDEQGLLLKWVRKELKRHIKEKDQFADFIKGKSKEVYKFLLQNNLM